MENQLADDLNEFYCRFEKTPLTSPGTPISSLLHSRSVMMMCPRSSQSEQLAPIFTQIFNRSLELCEVPSWFKHSTIIPVQKKPKITGLNYYRPVVTKSFEKLVLAYLKDITGPLLDPLKFAFRANRSVDDAVNMGLYFFLQHLDRPHSKKCWVKYSPMLGKYWTEHMLGCFQPTVNPTFWAVTQPLGKNNPIAGFIHILPSAGLYLT